MTSNEYHFITEWQVQGSVEEVATIIADTKDLVRWWPSVYLDVRELAPGAPSGVGKEIELHTKGWLPYTLRWNFRITEVDPPRRIALEAEGDFVGRGVWTFAQNDSWVDVTYDWRITAEKPLLRALSFLMKPIFSANHHWAMAKGLESLKLELARRRAKTPEQRATIPLPPGPTNSSSLPFLAGLIGVAALLYLLSRRAARAFG